jgi:hypothetical protein
VRDAAKSPLFHRLAAHEAGRRTSLLFIQQGVTLFYQPVELFALLRDAIGIAFFGLTTRAGCGLFHQLPEIVPKNGDTVVEFGS